MINISRQLLAVLFLFLFSSTAFSQDSGTEEAAVENQQSGTGSEGGDDGTGTGNATGISTWGLGFGLGIEQYRETFIEKASIHGDEKIVVTENTFDTRPSAWLTLNWNVRPLNQSKIPFLGDTKSMKWGFFAGVKLVGNSSDSFSSFALGPQITFETNKNRAISIGAGWVTHGTKEYARGITEGESLPAQFDDIVFEEGTENSYMVMMSVGVL